jgi:hypothetical protein
MKPDPPRQWAPGTRPNDASKRAFAAALDELGLTDPMTGKRPARKKPITVKALRERRGGS